MYLLRSLRVISGTGLLTSNALIGILSLVAMKSSQVNNHVSMESISSVLETVSVSFITGGYDQQLYCTFLHGELLKFSVLV
jgi:hypothetical protein